MEQDIAKVFEDIAKGSLLINIFDFLALACKFLDNIQLRNVIRTKIESSIMQGNFDAIVLIGLVEQSANSCTKLLQIYVDATADVQMAAYVAAYACGAA